eukprot:CAMPEP_0182461270 /NCGR_PEP_ID=MMETSP1319-20130603/5897_1 /TAXON_ID=172717 /ORGANISM="Bolidomonas pacifica, Strain RCC208" /LENGTH=474 /DNA_ID=CAMNT_0024660535 /DNA_START=218 /DNA_END=1638 /DNA_ORIENTATION=-
MQAANDDSVTLTNSFVDGDEAYEGAQDESLDERLDERLDQGLLIVDGDEDEEGNNVTSDKHRIGGGGTGEGTGEGTNSGGSGTEIDRLSDSRLYELSSKLSPSFTCYDVDELFEETLSSALSDSAAPLSPSPASAEKIRPLIDPDSDDDLTREESAILGPGLRALRDEINDSLNSSRASAGGGLGEAPAATPPRGPPSPSTAGGGPLDSSPLLSPIPLPPPGSSSSPRSASPSPNTSLSTAILLNSSSDARKAATLLKATEDLKAQLMMLQGHARRTEGGDLIITPPSPPPLHKSISDNYTPTVPLPLPDSGVEYFTPLTASETASIYVGYIPPHPTQPSQRPIRSIAVDVRCDVLCGSILQCLSSAASRWPGGADVVRRQGGNLVVDLPGVRVDVQVVVKRRGGKRVALVNAWKGEDRRAGGEGMEMEYEADADELPDPMEGREREKAGVVERISAPIRRLSSGASAPPPPPP